MHLQGMKSYREIESILGAHAELEEDQREETYYHYHHDHFVVAQHADEQHAHTQTQDYSAPHSQARLDRLQLLYHHIIINAI